MTNPWTFTIWYWLLRLFSTLVECQSVLMISLVWVIDQKFTSLVVFVRVVFYKSYKEKWTLGCHLFIFSCWRNTIECVCGGLCFHVHPQEIQSLLINWKGPDLTTYGELVLEGTFHVLRAKNTRTLFLFERMLLITKKRGEHYVYKIHISVWFLTFFHWLVI